MDYIHQILGYLRQLTGKPVRTLYVKLSTGENQGQELQSDDISVYFSTFGDVTSVHLHNEPNQSYAFVKFYQPESAAKALQTEIHTIAGCKVEIDAAHAQYQDFCLMDLPDDCLLEICSEKCLSVEDLCSVAETCRPLKKIAEKVFRRQYKKCDLLIPETMECSRRDELVDARRDGVVAKRVLIVFGSLISDLEIDADDFEENILTEILNLVVRYCGDSLDSLTLRHFVITAFFVNKFQRCFQNLPKLIVAHCTFEDTSKELFTDCDEMQELSIYRCEDIKFITEKSFLELKNLQYYPWLWSDEINLESFLSRHHNLQVVNIRGWEIDYSLMQCMAHNCPQLEQMQFDVPEDSTFDLSIFVGLKKLKIRFAHRNLTKSLLGWNTLHSLVEIKFEEVNIDSEFVRYLSQLKKLQILELEECRGINHLQQIDDTNQLTELKIGRHCDGINVDWPRLIQRLGNLKYIHLDVWKFNALDKTSSKRILRIVGGRPQKLQFRIVTDYEEVGVNTNYIFRKYRQLVEILVVCEFCDCKLN